MRHVADCMRVAFLSVLFLALAPAGRAADAEEVIAKLDAIDQSIAAAREINTRTSATIEELRKELYQSAVDAREAKRKADATENALADGETPEELLSALKQDIVNASVRLRDVNAQIKALVDVTEASGKQIEQLEKKTEKLRKMAMDPEVAREAATQEIVQSLEAKLAETDEIADERGKIIVKLNREIKSLKKAVESGGVVAGAAAPPVVVNPSVAKARALLEDGKVEAAMVLFREALYENPEDLDAQVGLAACQFESGDLEAARALVDAVLDANSEHARALGLLGAIQYRTGEAKKARRSLEKAAKMEPSNPYILNYLGAALFDTGRQEDGIAAVRNAIRLDADYIAAQYNLSVMLATSTEPDFDAARFHYGKSIKLGGPRDPLLDRLLGLEADAATAP